MIINKAGLITQLNLLSLNLQYPVINKLFVTGDIKQLPPNKGSLPNKIVLVGHEGCIDKL